MLHGNWETPQCTILRSTVVKQFHSIPVMEPEVESQPLLDPTITQLTTPDTDGSKVLIPPSMLLHPK